MFPLLFAFAAPAVRGAPANELYPELYGYNSSGHAAGGPDPLTAFTWLPSVNVTATALRGPAHCVPLHAARLR